MSDLPTTSKENPSDDSLNTHPKESNLENLDQLEQEIDDQIIDSINEQSIESQTEITDPKVNPANAESETNESNGAENEESLDQEDNVNQEEEQAPNIFNRVNILRVFNEMLADPDLGYDMEMSDNEEDDDIDDDAGFL